MAAWERMAAYGSPASRTMIPDISTWSKKPCNPSTAHSARGCHRRLGTFCYQRLRSGQKRSGGERGSHSTLKLLGFFFVLEIYPQSYPMPADKSASKKREPENARCLLVPR